MANISLLEKCYSELEEIKKELAIVKKANGDTSKTTFGETVCYLIKEHKAHTMVKTIRNSNDEPDKSAKSNVDETATHHTAGRENVDVKGILSPTPPKSPSSYSIAQEA